MVIDASAHSQIQVQTSEEFATDLKLNYPISMFCFIFHKIREPSLEFIQYNLRLDF